MNIQAENSLRIYNYNNTFSTQLNNPFLLQQYWQARFPLYYSQPLQFTSNTAQFGGGGGSSTNTQVLYDQPADFDREVVNAETGAVMTQRLAQTNRALEDQNDRPDLGDPDCENRNAIPAIDQEEINELSQDIMQVVAFLEADREQRTSTTQDEVFRVADTLFDQQLALFNRANNLEPQATREDEFLIRTVKDPELNETSFKRRAQLLQVAIDVMIEKFEQTGEYTNFLSSSAIRNELRDRGLNPAPGEAEYMSDIFFDIAFKFRDNWKFLRELPPRGSTDSAEARIDKLRNIRNIAGKVLDDNQTLSPDEFYFYAYFTPSPRQETTIFVQPDEGQAYLPFKESRPIEGPSLSSTIGTKLFQGDIRQPEGFLEASWGGASANVTGSDYANMMYYRSHVNYNTDDSAADREVLRNRLRESGLNGSLGGNIRIHADVGSIGCLELPIEDSVGVTGLARNGATPKMQTIPFHFTEQNMEYFTNKIEGHGDFWQSIYEQEKAEYQFADAVPVSDLISEQP